MFCNVLWVFRLFWSLIGEFKELVGKALLKVLSQMPKQDYKILIHLLPEKLVVSCIHT
jgi:hypothetical protein